MKKQQLANTIEYMNELNSKNKEYKDYCNSLNLLSNKLISYYSPDSYGKYKKITKEEHDELDKLFKDAISKSDEFLKNAFKEKDDIKDSKKDMSVEIHKQILDDYASFKAMDLNNQKSFVEEMDKTKNRQLGNISASNISFDGLFKKDELTVEYGEEKVSGTFFYKTEYDSDKMIDGLIKEFSDEYPQYKEYFSTLNDIETLNELASIKNSEMLGNNGVVINYFNKPLKAASAPKFDEYKNQLSFLNANARFIMKLRPMMEKINAFSLDLNVKKGINIDRRNVAVTNVAKVLNRENVVPTARAVAIENEVNGKKVYTEGTFVENAVGKTIDEFGVKDEIRNADINAWDTVEAKKDLANIQVLDYLCGNDKRDINSLKFNFDLETKKIIGIQGINNEYSFNSTEAKVEEALDEEIDNSDITKFKVIDEEMASKILSLDEASFKTTLAASGLDDKSVDNAVDRLNKLQDVLKKTKVIGEKDNIDKALRENKFVVVSADAWKNLKLENLAIDKNNIFSKAIDAKEKITGPQVADKSLADKYKVLKFTYNNKLLEGDKFLDEAKKNAPLFGTSRRYNNIIKSLNEYHNATVEEKEAKLENLKASLDVYNKEKIDSNVLDENGNLLKKLSGKDLARVNLYKDIKEYVKNVEALKKETDEAKALTEEDLKKTDEINQIYRRGKYANYAQAVKDNEGKILISSTIMDRERENMNLLKNTSSKIVEMNQGKIDKNPAKLEQLNNMKKYLDSSIESYKKQLKTDYEHGVIPKEYYDYKIERYDKKIFGLSDDEKLFKAEDPNAKIFKNEFQEEIKEEVDIENNQKIIFAENENSMEKENEMENDNEIDNNFEDSFEDNDIYYDNTKNVDKIDDENENEEEYVEDENEIKLD